MQKGKPALGTVQAEAVQEVVRVKVPGTVPEEIAQAEVPGTVQKETVQAEVQGTVQAEVAQEADPAEQSWF